MVGPLALLPPWQDENRNYSPSLSENLTPDPSRFNKNVNKRGLVGEKSGLDLVGK